MAGDQHEVNSSPSERAGTIENPEKDTAPIKTMSLLQRYLFLVFWKRSVESLLK